MMKAAWYEQQGAANKVLQVGEMPIPEIKKNEVLIRVHASGITPSDVKTRQGARGGMAFPRIIPHSDGAGVIEKIGSEVPDHRLGQRVWIYNAQWKRPFGTAAEFVVLPAHLAIPLPAEVTFEAGACLGIPAITAHRCVFAHGDVKGKTILVAGGAGSVGRYAIQFAKWGGATVISTISNDEKAKQSKSAGADYVINYRNENVVERIKNITQDKGVDHIVEVDFAMNLPINREIIKSNGGIATYASMSNPNPQIPFYPLMVENLILYFVFAYELSQTARNRAIQDIHTMLEEKILTHIIAAQFSLDKIVAAHEAVESGKFIGNVVLTLK